jgi:hypothetical protein
LKHGIEVQRYPALLGVAWVQPVDNPVQNRWTTPIFRSFSSSGRVHSFVECLWETPNRPFQPLKPIPASWIVETHATAASGADFHSPPTSPKTSNPHRVRAPAVEPFHTSRGCRREHGAHHRPQRDRRAEASGHRPQAPNRSPPTQGPRTWTGQLFNTRLSRSPVSLPSSPSKRRPKSD